LSRDTLVEQHEAEGFSVTHNRVLIRRARRLTVVTPTGLALAYETDDDGRVTATGPWALGEPDPEAPVFEFVTSDWLDL
jgi:hypothetical protein